MPKKHQTSEFFVSQSSENFDSSTSQSDTNWVSTFQLTVLNHKCIFAEVKNIDDNLLKFNHKLKASA